MIPDRPTLTRSQIMNDLRNGDQIIIASAPGHPVDHAIADDGHPRYTSPEIQAEFAGYTVADGTRQGIWVTDAAGRGRTVVLDYARIWRAHEGDDPCAGCGGTGGLHHNACPELAVGTPHDEPEPLPPTNPDWPRHYWFDQGVAIAAIPTPAERARIDAAIARGFPRADRAPSAPDTPKENTMPHLHSSSPSVIGGTQTDIAMDALRRYDPPFDEVDTFGDDQRAVARVAEANDDDAAHWMDGLTLSEARAVLTRLQTIAREHESRAAAAERVAHRIRERVADAAAEGQALAVARSSGMAG